MVADLSVTNHGRFVGCRCCERLPRAAGLGLIYRAPENADSSMRWAGDDVRRISCCVQPLSVGAAASCTYASTHLGLGCAAGFEDGINWVALCSFRPQRWAGLIGAQVEGARVGVE
jgi:hypothetical protein